MRRSLLILLACLAAGPAAARRPYAPDDPPPAGATLTVGSVTLTPCPRPAHAWCATLARPLDPSGRVAGSIAIAFEFHPRTDPARPAAGTLVATEGGPGFATTASRFGYLALFAPLRGDRDVLFVDNRGTGRSQAIDCTPLQSEPVQTIADVGACGASLGGASVLYGTPLAADDMAAVLDALGIGRIDLYGDSYGTFFGQIFAARHGDRLRSLTLDGAYPVIGQDPFYPNAAEATRRDFALACARAPACAALPGDPLDRLGRLVRATRAAPVTGATHDANGRPRTVTVDPGSLGDILYAGVLGPVGYRELDAAIRAHADRGDDTPLLRLVAENDQGEGTGQGGGHAFAYSRGLYAAVSCMDYPQIYDMAAGGAARVVQGRAAIAARRAAEPDLYAPLSFAEYRQLPIDISVLDFCLRWPVADPPYPPGVPVPAETAFPPVPTLVLSGELDALTTPAEGDQVTALLPAARHVIVANSFHVDAIDDVDGCASVLVRRFIRRLDAGDAGCAARVNAVRLVPDFLVRAADATPAEPRAGNAATRAERAMAAAAVQAAGDVLARWWVNSSGAGVGLRGGRFSYRQPRALASFTLTDLRWTTDQPVSGSVTWDQATGAIRARLSFPGGRVSARWNDRAPDAVARLSGMVGGHALEGEMPAP